MSVLPIFPTSYFSLHSLNQWVGFDFLLEVCVKIKQMQNKRFSTCDNWFNKFKRFGRIQMNGGTPCIRTSTPTSVTNSSSKKSKTQHFIEIFPVQWRSNSCEKSFYSVEILEADICKFLSFVKKHYLCVIAFYSCVTEV